MLFEKHIAIFNFDKKYTEDGKNKVHVDKTHISGDGFPVLTSSLPTMTEKDSFQPEERNTMSIQNHTRQTKNNILVIAEQPDDYKC